MPDTVLASLLTKLEIIVLERVDDDCFRPYKPMPDFAEGIFMRSGKAANGEWSCASSPFLDHFMVDAKEYWEGERGIPVWSELWGERDEAGEDQTFQAAALVVQELDFLVIFKLTELGFDRRQLLQQARKNLLLQRYLETEIEKRTQSLRHREEEIVLRLIGASDYRDEETGTHIRRMGLYAAIMAKKLGWNSVKVERMRLAASMHDVGKIGIPDGILLKSKRLSEPEFTIMKTHTLIGAKILHNSKAEVLRLGYEIALNHHENWDGSGYPEGKKGTEIPLSARCVTLCDVFDALAHDRVYRKALPVEKVLQIMKEMRGTKFDPDLFDMFLELLPQILEVKEQYQDNKKRTQYVPIWEDGVVI